MSVIARKSDPIQATDLINSGDPVSMDLFKSANTEAPTETESRSAIGTNSFDPHAPEFEYIPNATPETSNVDYFNNLRQSNWDKALRATKQFGANVASSFGQALANTFDLVSLGKTIKGEADQKSDDDFTSSIAGISTKDMQDWANGIQERNKIFEAKPGSFDPSSFGWWMNQIASTGTSIGMAGEAVLTTAAIEAITGGGGTGEALAKLGSLFSKSKNLDVIKDGFDIAKGLKSTATLYGVVNRYSESRMEGQNTYSQIYDDLSDQKDSDNKPKFNEDEKRYIASQGARRDFNWNLALLPLDILAYRTMVFNPVSGTGEGFLEKGLEHIAGVYGKSKVGKAAGWLTTHALGSIVEGSEEGFQQEAQNEGQHYAQVLSGRDDGKGFLERIGEEAKADDFWNNFAGGVIGSPVSGGLMNLANKAIYGNRAARMNEIHQDYIKNVGKMDSAISQKIRELDSQGKDKEASILRRQFGASKALAALHLDAMSDKDTAFDNYLTFLQGTKAELDNGKTDSLVDLGFNVSPNNIPKIQAEFNTYISDAQEMKNIHDNVSNKYNKNFVPEIAMQHFQLNRLLEHQGNVNSNLVAQTGKLAQYGDLSTQGKEIYNTEYQLQALNLESTRLTNLFRTTQDTNEKNNIQQVIDANKAKIEAVKTRLDEIGKDKEYTSKDADNDILQSALKDRDYLQATYDKTHLDNSIALQRKNIALWNDPKYIKTRNTESIKKATTKTKVEDTEADIKLNKQDTPDTDRAIQDKKSELAANEAATIVQQQKEQQDNANDVPGNANLFDEDNSFINELKETVKSNEDNFNEDAIKDKEPEYLFSPAKFDFDKSTDEAKNKVINGVRGLLNKLGDNSSFEGLIRHVVKVQGEGVADNIFNALKYGWEKNGMPVEDYQAVYNKIFGNPFEELIAGTKALAIQTNEQLAEVNDKVTKDIIAEQGKPEGFDNNNQPIYVYKGVVTNETSPKMAFSSRLSDTTLTHNEDGTTLVSNDYTEDELNTGDYVDSLQLLDPDKFDEGTGMTIKVPANFMDIKIPVYNADGTKGKAMTFGQYVSTHNLSPTSQEYQDKLPMIIYRRGAASTEKGVSFVHDIGWYHPIRFNQDKKGDMEEAISNTRAIRKAVIDNKNSANIIITSKRQTTFSGLKTKPNETVTLREANPQTQLTVALTSDSLSTSNKITVFPNDNTKLINSPFKPFKVGQVLDVRRYGKKNGIKTFVALPVLVPKLDEISKSSVAQAINIYANRSNKDTSIRDKHDNIVKNIKDTMGLDILSAQGLEKYLQHFITTFNTEKAKTNEDVESQARAKLSNGTPYISFIAGGNIVFGKTNEASYVDKVGNKKHSFFINPNTLTSGAALSNLVKPSFIDWYGQNLDLDNLNRNKPIITIDRTLNATTSSPTYNDFLLDRFRSNIKSYNIGTKEKPNYVTNIQPVITYDLESKLQQQAKTNEEIKTELLSEDTEDNKLAEREASEIPDKSGISELERSIIEQAKKDLGSDFGISKSQDTHLLSPQALTNDQKDTIGLSINRIAGLTPDQQFDITDFMYNQITGMVNLDSKMVTRAEVDRQVDSAFKSILVPLRENYQEKVTNLTNLLNKDPNLNNSSIPDIINDYKYRIAKVDNIKNSSGILKEEAYNRVAKYTGITQNKVQSEQINDNEHNDNEDEREEYDEEKGNEKERDFWTDILQENPESRLSYSMRRFFGQVSEYDRHGKKVTGFLGLPTYTGSDNIIRTLMVTLADTPSDFDTMIAKLDSRKEAIPWMQEVLDKLKGTTQQKKNQFVTVMSNTSLRMKFTMISLNRKTGMWTTKVWDTNLNGIADTIKKQWINGFINSSLVLSITDEENNYEFNKEAAKSLISKFEDWKGKHLKELSTPELLSDVRDKVKTNKPVVFTPSGVLLQELKTNIVKDTDRMMFKLKGYTYQISKLGNNKFEASFLKETVASKEEVKNWLSGFGIELSNKTVEELLDKGLLHNYKQRNTNELFDGGANTNGLFGILYNSIKVLADSDKPHYFKEYGDSPLDNTVINSLANLEAKYNDTQIPFGFRDNGKSIFALTSPKFITDRTRELKVKDSIVRQQLLSTSFSQNSLWLKLLSDDKFRDKFQVSHMGLTAFKQLGKKVYRDNGINKLSDLDHELTKLGMFWDTTQGEITYTSRDADGKDVTLSTYPDTSVELRMSTMFSPTMSDKKLMTLITTSILNLHNKDLLDDKGISDEVTKILYEQLVKPELQRISKFHQNGSSTDVLEYDKGAGMFLLLPEINNIEYTPGLRLIDAMRHRPNDFTKEFVEGNEDLMKDINKTIKDYVTHLVKEKIDVWKNNGLIETNVDNQLSLKYFDKKYIDKFRGDSVERANMAATDFVVNSLISNANSFMALAGDPAMYYKSKSSDTTQIAKDTFTNAGKRLANQIAPGTTPSGSENDKYIQVFLKDRTSVAENIEYLEKILGKDKAASYRSIEGSDAQEYTTWKEHLGILAKLGKTSDNLLDITPEEISEARELFSSDGKKALTERQQALIGKIMQPMKPVYTGQIYDPKQDMMRTMYIKSSSFPLIPQLTAGLEIDKLRLAMEKLEDSHKMNVRASYQTANKTGALNNPVDIWTDEGKANDDSLSDIAKSMLVLDRKNFRIQQDNPFKSAKTGDDTTTLSTQLTKLLFGDEIMDYDGFNYNGKLYSGKELHHIYNTTFNNLIQEKKNQLFSELGLDSTGNSTDTAKTMSKLQSILKNEATKRGYPLQDIEGLSLNENGEFNLPLWASANSNRYESMLNSIVTNRVIRIAMPGNSFIVGSEEGFRQQDNLEGVKQSKIIYTSGWDGKGLKANQVLIASKFKDREGKLIDLFKKQDGEYKYITKTDEGLRLKEDMFDKDLLSMSSFRLPTSGHQSASQIEVAGFLPAENADLMIISKNFTKQKGLDFDVDKENAYTLWNYMNDEGKFETLNESHRSKILSSADKAFSEKYNEDSPEARLLKAIFGDDPSFTKEDIESKRNLKALNSKINEKLMQNDIINITKSVLTNPNNDIQAKISKTLNTDYAEKQANFIDELVNSNKDDTYWTALSDEYQKNKMISGASGKIGTSAYSLDVVFHSLAQQIAAQGNPIELSELYSEGKRPKTWKFGTIESSNKLGGVKTIDGSRSISEVAIEKQNIAVDNEKLQVMGKVNLNEITIDVDKVMTMLGFDKGSDGNSISMLFMSQPILIDYVSRMRSAKSIMSDFDPNRETTIIDNLIKEYDGNNQDEINDEYWKVMSPLMSNDNFITAIKADVPDGRLQGAVLRRFIDMDRFGKAIRSVQVAINTDSKGLGKSFFDAIEKRNALNNLGRPIIVKNYRDKIGTIDGISNLIGDYQVKDEINQDNEKELLDNGYVDIGEFYVKPTTLTGGFSIHGVSTAYNLWSKFFPYDAAVTQRAFTEVMSIIGSEDMGDTKVVELKQDIFRGIKKYFSASKLNGIISATDDINNERKRLYIDSDDNTSIAKYTKSLKQIEGNDVINTYIKTNKLINRFEFDIQKNGQPSLIKYNNAVGEEFDEQYLYESLSTLINSRDSKGEPIKLPKIGNKEYTLDTYAQDLIAYSYLGNATQEAIQFTKYVPVSYLNVVGFSDKMRTANTWLASNPHVLGIRIGDNENQAHLVSEYTMQYVQHNPERVKYKLDNKNFSQRTIKVDNNSFLLKGEDKPTFVSVYDPSTPKGEKKFRLYWFDGEKYTKIPVLGTFGMDEYQPKNGIGTSLVNGRNRLEINPQAMPYEQGDANNQNSFFKIETGTTHDIVSAIASENITKYTDLAKALLPYIGETNTIVDDIPEYGRYNPDTNIITISKSIINNSELLANTVLHELVHGLTVKNISSYINNRVNPEVVEGSPSYVTDLVRIFNNSRSSADKSEIDRIRQKISDSQGLTKEERKIYGFTDLYEFISEALTNKEFQNILNTIPYKQSGQTLLDKFKDIIKKVLTSLGVKFDENFTAAHAINNIFEVIEQLNPKDEVNPYQTFYDDSVNNEVLSPSSEYDPINYRLSAIDILNSDKANQIFRAADKGQWTLEKILTELQIPKAQKDLLLTFGTKNREDLLTNLLANYSYVVEINTVKQYSSADQDYINTGVFNYNGHRYSGTGSSEEGDLQILKDYEPISEEEFRKALEDSGTAKADIPTYYYSDMTVPGGTNYTENEIKTPDITPSIKGHAQFSTNQGIGWFRADDKAKYQGVPGFTEDTLDQPYPAKTRRILEVQSDLFQKGRGRENLTWKQENEGVKQNVKNNQFLQLLNKDNNWVTFFIKSIIQDSAKRGYESVLFPKGDTAAKVEGHQTVENFIRIKEERIKELEEFKRNQSDKGKKGQYDPYTGWSNQQDWTIDGADREITQLKSEIKDAKEGKDKISSIANFYETTIKNILDKKGYEPEEVKDEYGNGWYKVSTANRESQILLSPSESRNQINSNTGEKTEDKINAYSPASDEGGAFTKFIQFKKSQLIEYNKRLGKIEVMKKEKGITVDKLTKLNNLERQIKRQIEGSFELGIKGLHQEISELEKNADTDAVGFYVEKDLNRLNILANSDNIDDLREAKRIIDFYDVAGTFQGNVDNPFFTQQEIFLDDENGNITGKYRLSDATMEKFKDWRDRAIGAQNIVDKRKEEVTVNEVNNNPSVRNTYGNKQFSFDDIMKSETGLKDTDPISMLTMDITSGIFSHNGIIPQVMFSKLVNDIEKKSAWSREISEKIDKINPGVQKELMKLGHSLRGIGILGIRGASYNLFKEITKEGNETGGLVQRFVKEYFDEQSKVMAKFQDRFNATQDATLDYDTKNRLLNKAFEDRKRWRRASNIILEHSKIPELMKTSTPEAEAYKKSLVNLLGKKGYKEQVDKQSRLLDKYEADRQSFIDQLLTQEGKTSENDLSPKGKSDISYWETNRSPRLGVEDYYSVNGIFFGDRKANNFMNYNVFVPRKFQANVTNNGGTYSFTDTNNLTGYHNDTFNSIENNPILSDFYDVIKEVCETIRENMPYDLQQRMPVNTIPALLKTSAEIIADKNTGILSSMSHAFRALTERVRMGFGVTKQSELSYATLDPVTGRPNYKVNDTFIQGNSRSVQQRMIIEKTKFIQAFNSTLPQSERISDIKRFSAIALSRMNPQSLSLLAEYINVDISLSDMKAGRISAISNITGDTVNIGKYIRDFSVHSTVQSQSFDLGKIAKHYSDMVMQYAARQEALPVLEIMKQHYESMYKPKTNNLGQSIYNVNHQTYENSGLRTNGIRQMDDWFERVPLNNFGTKHIGIHGDEAKNPKRLAKIDKRLAEINSSLDSDNLSQNMRDKLISEREKLIISRATPGYGKTIYSIEDKKKIVEIENLLRTEKEDKKREELIKIREGLGKARTATALIDNMLGWIRSMRLGYNLSSGISNFLEGVTSNMILAAEGSHFDQKEIYYAYNVVKHSFLKNVTFGMVETGLASKNRSLMDKFNVIMDSKNELQRSSHKSYTSKLSWLGVHELNQRVEYINQSPIMIAMLRTLKIKDKSGVESSVWDAMDNKGHLKDNFKTEDNVKNWEDLSGDQYLTFKQKLHKTIVLGHGNYDELRGMMAKSANVGKAAIMFKTWVPMQFYWRFATEQDDIQSGTIGYKGRYWSYGKGGGAVHGATVGTLLFGPLGALFGGAAGYFLGNRFGVNSDGAFQKTDSQVGLIKETVECTKQLAKKILGMPVNLLVGRKIIGVGDKAFENWVGKGNFTEQDAKNMRGNMADIVMQLAWLGLILAAKAMFWDDDDDPNDPERIAHNIIVNKLMILSQQGTMYINPVDTYQSTIGSNAVIQYLTDVGKVVQKTDDWMQGKDIIQSGPHAGESALANQSYKTFMPGMFKDHLLGFGSQADRVFTETPFHEYFKSDEKLDREHNKRLRAERENELEQSLDINDFDGDTNKEKTKSRAKAIRKQLDEELPTPNRLKKLGETREEYNEELKEENQ